MNSGQTFLLIFAALALQACAEVPTKEGEQAKSYEEPVVRLGSNIARRSPEEKSRIQTSGPEALEAMRDQQMRSGAMSVTPLKGN